MKQKGFTLIELLVVVAIISLLSTVVLASLNSAQIKARNTTRLASIHTLVNAFNMGLNDSNGVFPSTVGIGNVCVSSSCYGGFSAISASPTVTTFLALSLPKYPSDPVGGYGGYLYISPSTSAIIYNGNTWPVGGTYLQWFMESTSDPNICGNIPIAGISGNYTHCIFRLDQ